jgi:DNA (cytosine-5)-methyltransferase 1
MKAASLFTGIGAPETAMPHWEWMWGAEINPFADAVMAYQHPEVRNLGDVRAYGLSVDKFIERARRFDRPDVIVWGSPCQSFSHAAGRRLGLDDRRGNLALVGLAIIEAIKPTWFVFENVPGLLSSNGGRDFGAFLGRVQELRYEFAWRVLDAQHFGVPQRRRRVFVVGHKGDREPAGQVLFEREGVPRDPAAGEESDEDPREAAAGAGGGASGGRKAATIKAGYHKCWNDSENRENLIVTRTLKSTYDNEANPVVDEKGVRRYTPLECERLQGFPDYYTRIPWRGRSAARCPDGPRHKAIGNSMAVPVIRWVLGRIESPEGSGPRVFPESSVSAIAEGGGDVVFWTGASKAPALTTRTSHDKMPDHNERFYGLLVPASQRATVPSKYFHSPRQCRAMLDRDARRGGKGRRRHPRFYRVLERQAKGGPKFGSK